MIIYNFNNTRYGKTYYETAQDWSFVKKRIKQILDEKNSCKEHKIYLIKALLDNYKETYLTSKDGFNGKN